MERRQSETLRRARDAEDRPMGISITTAPCCWGVDDVRNPNLPPWERVFDEAAAAGYRGLELGPYGYVPLDVDRSAPRFRHAA